MSENQDQSQAAEAAPDPIPQGPILPIVDMAEVHEMSAHADSIHAVELHDTSIHANSETPSEQGDK